VAFGLMYKTALPLVCSGLFRRAAFFVGRIKKENKILVKYREKVYTFPSLKRGLGREEIRRSRYNDFKMPAGAVC
jgi:hypothetical protein